MWTVTVWGWLEIYLLRPLIGIPQYAWLAIIFVGAILGVHVRRRVVLVHEPGVGVQS